MGHTQTENYDLSQPICENPQLALEALKQIIQANKDGNNETAIFMTVKRCQTCGAWPTCRLDSNGETVTMVIGCPQDTNHPRYVSEDGDTLKDIVRAWNHQNSNPFIDDYDKKIANYNWDEPITEPYLAEDVFSDCLRKQSEPEKAKMKIEKCARCGEYPVADVAVDTFVLGCPKCKRIFWARKCDSLTAVATDWNREQEIMETNKESLINTKLGENEMATTGEMIEKYDWDEPIKNNRELAADALEACIERNFPEKSQFDGAFMYGIPAKMEILRHRNSGEIPKVMKAEDGSNIGIGVEGLCYVWACPSETLTTLVDTWNKLQGKAAKETTEEPPKETSLDVMGRNALALPQQAKTIDELEAEADRGLSKPEDIQKLKEANVLTDAQKAIPEVCDEIKELLLEKNRKYGNSALNPCRIFARSDRLEQIRVRIDDKLNRIKNEQWNEDEDVVKDLIGYLVLYTVAQLHDFND